MSYPPPTGTPFQTPYAQGPSDDEKTQAMLSWILCIIFGFIPPLIFFLMADGKPYLKRQTALALTMILATYVMYMACGFLFFLILPIFLAVVIWVWTLVLCIQGAIASHRGENFEPALISGWCRSLFKL